MKILGKQSIQTHRRGKAWLTGIILVNYIHGTIGNVWEVKPARPIASSECERACHLCVGFLRQGGMHTNQPRDEGWILNDGISASVCLCYCGHQHQHRLAYRSVYLWIWFETASLHSAPAQPRYVRARIHYLLYVCKWACIHTRDSWTLALWNPRIFRV